nr:hypothetical protein [Gammaproteobacteria bacterium]
MKKIFLVIFSLLFVFVLTACEKIGQNEFNQARVEGTLGAFSLKAPTNNGSVKTIPTFEWNASENAETYILEVASSTEFNQQEDAIYVKKAGISETSFKLFSNLKYKNYTYYWRVTAVNKGSKKVCNEVFSFFYEANLDEEIEYTIEHADEWEVHKDGSPVNVSIDSTNFFGNDKKALKIDFTHEIMNASNDITHDGWAVVTHHQEEEMYGVDAFYFEFYYSGQDSSIWFRCVDEDNEYYNAEIKVANNTKQQVIIKFDDFTLRTKGGTPIVNQKFDYNMIKYVELVFEKTFGDGTCYVSNIKAINFDKYRYMFIDELDFNEIDSDDILTENYDFEKDYSDDGKSFTMSYGGSIGGYGFTKFNINKFVEAKDAVKVKVEYTGTSSARMLLRVIEEDKDRWVYKQDLSALPEDGYIVIPIQAFTLSEYNGNGAREFYFIKQIQFGIEGVYQTGSLTFSNLEFVNVRDEVDNLYKASVGDDGLIENFNNYKANAELYYKWIISNSNKDEAIATNKTYQMGNNNLCGELTYKSDMFGAQYGLQFDKVDKGYTSISFKALDKSVLYIPDGVNRFSHLTDANAVLAIYIITEENQFKYVDQHLEGEWTSYVVPFSEFKVIEGEENAVLKSEDILGFGIELSYYYYLSDKKADPVYTSNNHVYFDDIYFTKETEASKTSVYKKITTDPTTQISMIDDFNDYETSDNVMDVWSIGGSDNYSALTLESNGEGNNCLKMQYKGNSESVSYVMPTIFAAGSTGKAIVFDLKGDGKNNTFYINIFVNIGGSNLKLRYYFTGVTDEWKRYTIGFENFEVVEGSPATFTLSSKNVPNIQKI